MTHLAPHPTHLRTSKPARGSWRLAVLAGLGVVAASSATAQVQIGGNRPPSVSVDLTVLEQLGPAPNLPQLFGASRPPVASMAPTAAAPAPRVALQAPRNTSTAKKPPRVAHHRATTEPTQVAKARAPQPSPVAPDRSVQLVPPSPAAPTSGGPRVTRDPAAPTAPAFQPASVASPVPAPAPLPAAPQSTEAPPPPVVAATPPHDVTPNVPQQPPAQAHNDNAPVPLTAPPPAPAASVSDSPAPAVGNDAGTGSRPGPVQVASAAGIGSVANTIKFAAGAADLPSGSQPVLDSVAAKLLGDDALRVQLVAHATGSADQAMEARRVSLARAVAVRAYLIDKGVRSLRMDVRALGNRSDDGPATDQVDLLIVSQ